MKRKFEAINGSARRLFKYLFMFGIPLLVFLIDQPVFAKTFVKGDVFAALNGGLVKHYSADGTFIETLNTGCGGYTTGMAFDSAGNLYVTCFSASKVFVFDNNGSPKGAFGTGYSNPESITFDRDGNAFVGNLSNGIRQYGPSGNFLKTIINTRVDWLDITGDNKTIYYTQESSSIYTVDIATGKTGPNFANGASHAYALRILPDGGVLMADTYNVKRYDNTGRMAQTYSVPNENTWFSLNRDPDGTSFWSGNFGTGKAYKFDIATGRLLKTIDTQSGYYSLFGLVVYGELTAAKLAATNLRVVDTISTINNVLDTASFSKTPTSITNDTDDATVEWKYDSFSIGQEEDITFNVLLKNPQPNEDRLVNHNFQLFYTDVNGNSMQVALNSQYVHVLNSAFDASISTDKPVYPANEDVLLNGAVKNLSEYGRILDAKIVIEDSQGAAVAEIPVFSSIGFAAGEARNFNNVTFNTAGNFAGDYKAHLILYENQKQVGESFASFKIQETIAANSAVTTDKTAYTANDLVTISSSVVSTSPNHIFENLSAKVSLADSQGQVLFTYSKIITMLAPGGRAEFKSYWNASTNSKGIYTVKLEVFDGGAAITTSQTSFEILSSSQTGAGLTGTLNASPNPVYHGKDETITYSMSNGGNEDLTDVQASILIIDPDTQEIKVQYNAPWAITGGATVNGMQGVPTGLLPPKMYLAVLRAKTSMMTEAKTLASAPFEVQLGIDVAKTIPDIQRVLVWMNYPCATGETGPNCPDQARVEQALKDSGITYAIVNSRDDFTAGVSNAFYTDYAILGDSADLDDAASEMLRKKVYAGKGLVSSLYHRENLDQAVFGMTFLEYLPGQDYVLEPQEGEAALSSFTTAGRGSSITADPADIRAWIAESPDVKHPGVIKRAYGRGQGVYVGIDLGLSSSGDPQQYAALTKYLLAAVHTAVDPAAVPPRELVPVEVKLTNLGSAIDVSLAETYPAAVALMDPESKTWPADNPWTRLTRVDADASQSLLYYALTPNASGPFKLWTGAAYLEGGAYTPFKNVSVEIDVTTGFYTDTIDIGLMPFSSKAVVGTTHQVTATVTNLLNEPRSGLALTFNIISGPNQGIVGVCGADAGCRTDADGRVTFSYVGAGRSGIDKIQACYASQDPAQESVCSQVVTQEWTGGINLGKACRGTVIGLQNTKIVNSLVTIYGDEYVSQGGSLANNAPSTINGNVYEYATRQYSGPGKLNGSIIADPTLVNQVDTDALNAAATSKALVSTKTFGNISSPTTVTGNGGLNVIQVNGNITSSLILSGSDSDIFIVNVTGTLNIGGSYVLGVAGNVNPGNVLYNFTGTGGTIATHVDNVVNGTLLAPKYSFNLDGVFNGRIIGGGSSISLLSGAVVNGPTSPCP